MRTFIVFLILLVPLIFSPPVRSGEDYQSDFREFLRPYMDKILGKDTSTKILGEPPEKINLPKIPQIGRDAKSLDGLEQASSAKQPNIPQDKKDQYNFEFLHELYQFTLGRGPSDEELSKWMNNLNQGGSREGIYRAVVLSSAYEELEKFNSPPTERELKFTRDYLQKYVNVKVADNTLQEMNHHSIKRVCVEKSLELMDVFSRNPESLYDWYAVLSGDLARDYQGVLGKNLRGNPSRELHKKWAGGVPIDFVKSEIIIKLHKIFNSLM